MWLNYDMKGLLEKFIVIWLIWSDIYHIGASSVQTLKEKAIDDWFTQSLLRVGEHVLCARTKDEINVLIDLGQMTLEPCHWQ